MNVFWHELKVRRRGMIIWSVSMMIFMVLCMVKYKSVAEAGGAAINELFSTMPTTLQAVLGMNGLDIATLSGYFGICFLFVAIILAVQSGLAGANVLAAEAQTKTIDFLFVKPRTRASIITAKLLVAVLVSVVVWVSVVVSSIVSIQQYASMDGFWQDFWVLMAGLAYIQLACFAVGFLSSAYVRSTDGFARAVIIFVMASYILYVLAKASPLFSWAEHISIFSYFDAATLLALHHLPYGYVGLVVGVSLGLIAMGYVVYQRRDLQN